MMQQHSAQPMNETIGKIALECEEAGASKWDVVKIIKSLSERETLDIEELRKEAISLLRGINPEAAEVYASFHRMHVHTSGERIEGFDRGNIIKSLLKETSLPRAIAERIGHEVEGKIKDLKISYLDTALIRELVNARLLEYGYENIYRQYARIGLPSYDIAEKISKGFYGNCELLKGYSLQRLIPQEIRERHFSAEIHISALGDFPTKPYAYCIPANEIKEAASAEDFIFGLGERIAEIREFFSLPISVEALNMAISKHLVNAGNRKIAETSSLFFRAFGAFNGKCTIGISLFAPEGMQVRKDGKSAAIEFANALLLGSAGYDGKFTFKIAVDSPAELKLLKGAALRRGAYVLNCKSNNLRPLAQGFYSKFRNGILSCVNANLTGIALSARGNDADFFGQLEKCINSAKKIAEIKLLQLGQRAYLKERGIGLDSFAPMLCIDSLFGAAAAFSGENAKETMKFAERTMDAIRKSLGAEWIIAPASDDEAGERFAYENSRKFSYRASETESTGQFMKSDFIVRKYYSMPCAAGSISDVQKLLAGNAECVAM
ncbi:MAG: hypothetical protein HYW05_02115 [Candidatus Diapherotrites archaeon]|nr:hypothetical protein [Candidatus Diapherotrites archaeon]